MKTSSIIQLPPIIKVMGKTVRVCGPVYRSNRVMVGESIALPTKDEQDVFYKFDEERESEERISTYNNMVQRLFDEAREEEKKAIRKESLRKFYERQSK